ncbi:cobyrinate a,c-diamide synthase [Tissierella sp. MSJ-40]|uniref:Cobyrinate a,c-diamide synthase n=1 Tax=Tissierella simiarum TaxID=2841534 RepID=A0ABS6E4S1_9FIRM|nr:cobyrinate a,c-diamide synthase [Tissierella simiarum]MBU5437440.1 cobyrinate a,c-diamide synthase [Tissierella simiarum]
MKLLAITGPNSGSGKTLLTLGIIRSLKNRGLDVSAFKTGPDYIDTKYLSIALGKRAGNLDFHLMGKEGVFNSIGMNKSEIGIIEGAMGYFDGISNTFENSTYDIVNTLKTNSILVYTPKGEMFSAIPQIKGMVDFPNSNIKGIIFNKVSKEYYLMLKEQVEKYIDIEVLGYLEFNKDFEIQSRHLGLLQSHELSNIEEIINMVANKIEETIDLDSLLKLAKDVEIKSYNYPMKKNIKIAIAYDDAFSFYYGENLNLFENICHVDYFSPLKDEYLPECNLVYLGGGYPELYKEELSKNQKLIKSIKNYGEDGGFILAEGGGLMYLTEHIDGSSMVELIKGYTSMENKNKRFGYVNMRLEEDIILGKRGDLLTGNEFHKSQVKTNLKEVININKPKRDKFWSCGYQYKNTLAMYQHINFLGNMDSFEFLLNKIEQKKRR